MKNVLIMGEETNSIERYGHIGPLRDQPRPNRRQKFVDRDSMREDNNSVRDLEECGSASHLLQFVGRHSKVELQLTRYISLSNVQSFLGDKNCGSRTFASSWFHKLLIKQIQLRTKEKYIQRIQFVQCWSEYTSTHVRSDPEVRNFISVIWENYRTIRNSCNPLATSQSLHPSQLEAR